MNRRMGRLVVTLWNPTTEQEIAEGIQSGVLRENHYIEVKEQARNEQVAQTLASLAIDGGMFILGIAEKKNENGTKLLTLAPLPLEGWVERIDGIARNNVEPPLPVRVSTIPSEADHSIGYLVLRVAASPQAPHMTGGKYYGRGEASKHSLSDAEVLRHHERRQGQANFGNQLLDEAEANDYLPAAQRTSGHMYFVAEPLLPINKVVVEEFLRDENGIRAFIRSAQDKCRTNLRDWYPTPRDAFILRQRDSGVSVLSTDADGPGRSLNPDRGSESGLLDIELTENGGLRILLGRGTEGIPNTDEMAVIDGLAVAYTERLVHWIGRLAEKYDYHSTWTLGLRINGIAGLRAYPGTDIYGRSRAMGSMERDVYSRICAVASDSIVDAPVSVVKGLVGPLLRVLGSAGEHGLAE